jgi:hypothetical protein
VFKKSGKSIDKLLLHCKLTRELQSSLFQLFGVAWVMSRWVRDLLVSWRGQLGQCMVLELWRLAPLCLLLCIWREKNARNFEGREMAMLELKKMLFLLFIYMASRVVLIACF